MKILTQKFFNLAFLTPKTQFCKNFNKKNLKNVQAEKINSILASLKLTYFVRTQHMPWADGTPCGEGLWCMRSECVPMGDRDEGPVDGSWADWKRSD